MYKVCSNCGFMYDDATGACPQCQNNNVGEVSATQVVKTDVSKQEESKSSIETITSVKVSEKGAGLSDKRKFIVIATIVLAVLVFIASVVLIFITIGRNQSYGGNNGYYDEYNDYDDYDYDDYDENDGYYESLDFYVYLEPNNGDSQESIYMSESGFIPEPNEPVREGYEFEGWYTDEYFNEKWYFDTDEATETLTLYANWVEDEEDEKLVLAVDGLRLRDRPDTNGRQIGLIPNGTKITITEIKNGWAYTSYKGVAGWCSCDFLYNPSDYEDQMLFKAYVKNKSGINLYSEKSTNSSVEKYGVKYKSFVQVYEVDDKWSYVYYDGEYGWCLSDDIDDVK